MLLEIMYICTSLNTSIIYFQWSLNKDFRENVFPIYLIDIKLYVHVCHEFHSLHVSKSLRPVTTIVIYMYM